METAHGERRGQRDLPAKGGDQRNRQRRPAQLSRVNAAYGTRVGQSQVRGVVVCAGIQRDALWRGAAALGEPQESKSCWSRNSGLAPVPATDRKVRFTMQDQESLLAGNQN